MNDIDKLIASNRDLLANLKRKPVKQKHYDGIIFKNKSLPAPNTPNYKSIHVFNPTEVPEKITNGRIILHKHKITDNCNSRFYCHELGYKPGTYVEADFLVVWGYLYNPPIKLDHIKFDMEM